MPITSHTSTLIYSIDLIYKAYFINSSVVSISFRQGFIETILIVPSLSQRIRPVGLRAVRPIIQAWWTSGHETLNIRAGQLEQLHLSEAGCGCQATGLHRPHLQPDVAHRHVDGLLKDRQESRPQGWRDKMFSFRATMKNIFKSYKWH